MKYTLPLISLVVAGLSSAPAFGSSVCDSDSDATRFACRSSHTNFRGSSEHFNFVSNIAINQIEGNKARREILLNRVDRANHAKLLKDMSKEIGDNYASEKASIQNWSLIRRGVADGIGLAGDGVDAFLNVAGVNKAASFFTYTTKVVSKAIYTADEIRVQGQISANETRTIDMAKKLLQEKFSGGDYTARDYSSLSKDQLGSFFNEMRERFNLDPDSMTEWSQDAKDLYTHQAINAMAKLQIEFQRRGISVMNDVQSDVKKIAYNFKKHSKTIEQDIRQLKQTSGEVQEHLVEIKTIQLGITEGLTKINQNILNNSTNIKEIKSDVIFIKTFAMGKMSATQQMVLINKNILVLENLKKKGYIKSVAKYKEQIATLAKVEKLQARMKKFTTAVSHLSNIANNLGLIGQKHMGKINKGINAITGGVALYSGVMTSNPIAILGGISNITSLFGKKAKMSPGAQRHQQVMEGMNRLLKGQQQILKGISQLGMAMSDGFTSLSKQISENFEMVIGNQKLIADSVQKLDNKVTNYYIESMHKLDTIYYSTLVNREILQYIASKDMNRSCDNYLFNMASTHNDYDTFYDDFEDNFDYFEKCIDGLRDTFSFKNDQFPIPPTLKYSWHLQRGDRGQTDHFVREVYNRTVNFAFKHANKIGVKGNDIVSSAYVPLKHTYDIEKKIGQLKPLPENYFGKAHFSANALISTLLHPVAVYKSSSYLLKMHSYYEMIDIRKKQLKTVQELYRGARVSKRGQRLVNNSIKIVNTSMAQLNILSGDLILPMLNKIFTTMYSTGTASDLSKSDFVESTALLFNNPILARNFLIYQLNKELKAKGHSYLGYKFALGQKDTAMLRHITKSPWRFSKLKDGKWVAEFYRKRRNGTTVAYKLPLPSAEELESGEILYKSDFSILNDTRSMLENAVMSYKLPQTLTRKNKKVLFNLLLIQNF